MSDTSLAIVILAAGKGTRMESDLPKVMHPLGQVPMLHHAMSTAQGLDPDRVVVVTGYGADTVADAARDFSPNAQTALQAEQLGTGHAVRAAETALSGFSGKVVVIYGDTPFVRTDTLREMVETSGDVVVLGFEAADPGRYGRLILADGALDKIVEAKDATEEELSVTLCNSGVVCCDAALLFDLLGAVDNNNSAGEYYLTDIVAFARARGLSASVVRCDEAETLGINSKAELMNAETRFQAHARQRLLDDGVVITSPDTIHLAQDTTIGRDAVIEPYVVFGPGVTVESGAHVKAFSHLEGAHVSRDAVIGPYARLRPGAEIAEAAKIGNFVEIKNAEIAEGAKVNHLSYIGDASVGTGTNIGAGTITCNYDGVLKHRTEIGENAFIGSNSLLVAPVTIGDAAYTASGSVITNDVPAGDLAIGRTRQVNKPGLARKMMARLKALKAGKAK